MRILVTCLTLLAIVRPLSAAVTVDFEDLPNDDGDKTSVDSRGFNFATDPGHFELVGGNPGFKHLGTRTGAIVTMTKIGGGLFGIDSLNLDGGSTQIMLTGFFSGGGSTSQTFTLDGLPGLQTFHPTGFVGLSSAVLQPLTSPLVMGVDNIVTPEPSAVVLFAPVAGLLPRRRRSRGRRRPRSD